ncbi:MAG: DEAD/DEAH box helicase [Alphaproteobacteria bacterium]|nr:DEAD/DEAH box helicase [Alphaproteobacteria bacterium]
MQLRNWQQEVIDKYPDIIKAYRRFILKAPTGAGKTVLASEIVDRFYRGKKVIVLCHRLVLLEQLTRELGKKHKVKQLELSDTTSSFDDVDILLSTNMRGKEIMAKAVPQADLIIVDEAHRVSPIGRGYRHIFEDFEQHGREDARLIGLTASPERRTGDQKDQLGVIFDAILDCADVEGLIEEGILVRPQYRPHFIHDLDLADVDITAGDFPVATLSSAIIRSSMIDYAANIYLEERGRVRPRPISAWFCPDVAVAEKTHAHVAALEIDTAIITAQTPMPERMALLARHEAGELEALISVGVLSEGWDNPNCNIIVHLRPTLSKVLWGQTVGRGLRSAKGKSKCVVIDVSSNWSTFGPVEKLEWTLWNHRRSFLAFKNRFHWINQNHDSEDDSSAYFICEGKLPSGLRCSRIYAKQVYSEETCPQCGSPAAIDIWRERQAEASVNDVSIHRIFFDRMPQIYAELDHSVWRSLDRSAWEGADAKEQIFLVFCKAFELVSDRETGSPSEYWDAVLEAEAELRAYLVRRGIKVGRHDAFDLGVIADGFTHGRYVRTLQSSYGISVCGTVFAELDDIENERKYQKALKIVERITVMGCSSRDNLPYFKAADVSVTPV